MEKDNRVYLNAYHLLLIIKILDKKFQLGSKKLRNKDYEEIAYEFLIKDTATIRKLFNDSYLENIPQLRRKNLNVFVEGLQIDNISNWDDFINEFPPTSSKSKKSEFIPIGHYSDLSEPWKKRIVKDVNISLAKMAKMTQIFPKDKDSEILIDIVDLEEEKKHSSKMKKLFLNTTWYTYLITNEFEHPKIARTILRIGDSSEKVETEALKVNGISDFSGTAEFDENGSFLVLNLKTKETLERWVHIKMDANTSVRPEIMLGQYQNIGIGGVSLHFSNIVMEFIPNEKQSSISSNYFDATDPRFSEVPIEVQKYLQDMKLNYAETSYKIYSLYSLGRYVDSDIFKEIMKPRSIRLGNKYRAFIGFPRRALDIDKREKYLSVFKDLKSYLGTQNFEIREDILTGLEINSYPFFSPEFHLRRVQESDLFILIYFDSVRSKALSELAWAYQANKEIFILTSKDGILPSIYKNEKKVEIQEFENMQEAIQFFKKVFEYYVEKRFPKLNSSE